MHPYLKHKQAKPKASTNVLTTNTTDLFLFFFCFLFFPFVFMNGTKMMSDNQAVQNKPVEQPNALF